MQLLPVLLLLFEMPLTIDYDLVDVFSCLPDHVHEVAPFGLVLLPELELLPVVGDLLLFQLDLL